METVSTSAPESEDNGSTSGIITGDGDNLQGLGTIDDPYLISDVQSLYDFAAKATNDDNSKNNFQNTYVELTADIAFNDTSNFNNWDINSDSALNVWTGIPEFNGHFNGNGHTISGLFIKADSDNLGFFDHCSGASIHDICFSDAAILIHGNSGIVAGNASASQFDNVSVYGKTIETGNSASCGGLAGFADASSSFSNCVFLGTVEGSTTSDNVGGIIGTSQGVFLSDCSTDGTITGHEAGGMIGYTNNGGNASGTKLKQCHNRAEITGGDSAGGLIGHANQQAYDYSNTIIEQCSNSGNNIVASCAGGLIGHTYITNNSCRISESFNSGSVAGSNYGGGIEGYTFSNWGENYITDCYNNGTITGNFNGGIVGTYSSNNPGTVTITNCFSYVKNNANLKFGVCGQGYRGGWYLGPVSINNVYYRNDGNLNGLGAINDAYWYNYNINNVTGLSRTDFMDRNKFSGFDFSKIWRMGYETPFLKWENNKIGTDEAELNEFTFSHPLPVIRDEKKARAFLCFIFNKNASEMDNISNQDKYLQLITGNLTGTDDDKYMTALSLLQIINANLIKNDSENNAIKEQSSEQLIDYIEKRFGVDENSDPASQSVNDAINSFKGDLKKVVLGLATIEDQSYEDDFFDNKGLGIRTVPLLSGQVDWITESMEKVQDACGKKDDLKNYVYDLAIALHSANLILSSEYTGRYQYFEQYLEIRRLFGPEDEQAFDLLKETIKFTLRDNNWFAEFIPVITAGTKSSWSSNTDLIDEWAEYTYQLREAVFNPESSESATPAFQNYTYNQIQCPVDVDVIDADGNVVASIKNNTITKEVPENLQNQLYITTVGEAKHIFINEGAKFQLNITATASGTMNYSSSAIRNGKETIVNNTDSVDLANGKKFTVAYQDETDSTTSYSQLIGENNNAIPVSNNSKSSFDVDINIIGNGFVTGSTRKREGDNVLLRAVPEENNYFSHWQDDEGNPLSSDDVLQFTLSKNENITAVFTDIKPSSPGNSNTSSGQGNNSSSGSNSNKGSTGNSTKGQDSNKLHFTDVPEKAYYSLPVYWAIQNGVTKGATATTFAPNNVCTRAQMVTFLWNLAGMPEPASSENPFSDIAKESWYYKAVIWAAEEHITTGTSENTFSPNKSCTRAEAVTFLWNMNSQPKTMNSENSFSDVNKNKWYEKAVNWATAKGITTGTSKNTFSPDDICTRGQSITFIYRMKKSDTSLTQE